MRAFGISGFQIVGIVACVIRSCDSDSMMIAVTIASVEVQLVKESFGVPRCALVILIRIGPLETVGKVA